MLNHHECVDINQLVFDVNVKSSTSCFCELTRLPGNADKVSEPVCKILTSRVSTPSPVMINKPNLVPDVLES